MNALRIRPADPRDAAACAEIRIGWQVAQSWIPALRSPDEIRAHYRDKVFKTRQIWVAGKPVTGFIALAPSETPGGATEIASLYVSIPGKGLGKALMDVAKDHAETLELWTFEDNTRARRFYCREGFREILFETGGSEEGLPEVQLRWERGWV